MIAFDKACFVIRLTDNSKLTKCQVKNMKSESPYCFPCRGT